MSREVPDCPDCGRTNWMGHDCEDAPRAKRENPLVRIRIAWHLRRKPWEALDYLFACRWRWLCDKHDDSITGGTP